MNIEKHLDSLRDIVQWIYENTKGIEITGGRKQQIASACFDVAIEHQAAIALLCKLKHFGSMHALMRILIESVVRGLWILYCATDAELDIFEKRGIEMHFGDLTAEIEKTIGSNQPTLSQMKVKVWREMNDFTHTGYIQVTRRHGEGVLGSNYPEENVIKCINAAGAYGLLASSQLSVMAKQDTLTEAHLKKMGKYANTP
jgi:hypothetical protein